MPDKPSSKNRRRLPPVETRWKKGESGNPKGRPKKQDSLTSLLKEEIKKICPADREKRTWKELIVRATLQLAMKGNATALREVWDRLDGKTLQTGKLQLGDADGKQININVVYADDEKGDLHPNQRLRLRQSESGASERRLPPAETSWKKGVSGNPRGRPKKAKE